MLYYDRIDIKVTTRNNSKQCLICINHGFKFQDSFCNSCHVLTMPSVNMSDIAIITIKNLDYCCIIHNISKPDAITLLESPVPENCGYI